MRLPILQSTTSVACLGAGVLLTTAFQQTSLPMTASFAGGGVLLFLAANAWSWMTVQGAVESLNEQARDPNLDHFDKTGLREFDNVGRKICELRRDAINRERQVELEIADATATAKDQIKKDFEAVPSVAAQFRAIQGYLASMDGHAAVGVDGQPLSCLEQLKRVFRRFQSDVASDMGQVLSCGREINRTTEELVNGSESQSEAAEKTNSLAEQLSDRVGMICGHAIGAREACSSAKNAAEGGLTQIASLSDDISQIKNQTSLRERKLQSLGQHTREVESIVQTIGTLSSRTDLLALNASIESVRAGEHGRGFALVAEEVRALSEQSAQAVEDITARLEMIQMETSQSITLASDESSQLDAVVNRINESLNVLESICRASSESTDGLEKITMTTDEQLKLTQDIVETLQRSAETARINRSRAQGANWKAKSFDDLGVQIESTLRRFGDGEQTTNASQVR